MQKLYKFVKYFYRRLKMSRELKFPDEKIDFGSDFHSRI